MNFDHPEEFCDDADIDEINVLSIYIELKIYKKAFLKGIFGLYYYKKQKNTRKTRPEKQSGFCGRFRVFKITKSIGIA